MESLLGVILSEDPKNMDCEYVIDNWLRVDTNLSKLKVPKDVHLIIDSYFYGGDEWIAWGKNLEIVQNDNNNNSKIQNIGSTVDDDQNDYYRSRGSAYGLRVVDPSCSDQYYWKIRVGDEYEYTYAVGFVKEDNGVIDGNGWYIKNQSSVGIYSDKQIWTNSVLLCNDGILFRNKDLINLCIDYNKMGVYVQRLEYIGNVYNDYQQISDEDDDYDAAINMNLNINENDNKITDKEIPKNYIIHDAKRVFGGIDVNSNYRLACYLRTENQNVEIIKFSTHPFKEWQVEETYDNDKRKEDEDKPVIIMYQ